MTSNRTPDEWLSMMADPLLAQPAVDRLVSTAHELIIEGPSYQQRQKPSINGRCGHPAARPLTTERGLLTPDDVCALLKVKKSWLYDAVEDGAIQAIRLGKQLRFRPSALIRYLDVHASKVNDHRGS